MEFSRVPVCRFWHLCKACQATVGFWANAKMFEVTDATRYNRAMCKLFCGAGVAFALLGLPLLSNHAGWIMLSCCVGVMMEIIALILIYTQVIEKKYRKR